MNNIEKEIVNHFIIKNRQERLLWELNSPRKRNQVFWQFAGPKLFKKECIDFVDYMSSDQIEKFAFTHTTTKNVYYIGEDYIGELSIKQAIDNVNLGMICIVYFGNGFGFYQGEEEHGNRPRCLLKSKL